MRLGFAYNVRAAKDVPPSQPGLAGDAEEEFDSQQTIDAIASALQGGNTETVTPETNTPPPSREPVPDNTGASNPTPTKGQIVIIIRNPGKTP